MTVAVVAALLGLVIGSVIGGLGGGGGVLTVPVLVFLLGQSAHDATTGSVVIVGTTALVGVLARIREHGVEWRTGLAVGAVGIPAAYLGTGLNRAVGQSVLMLAFAALTVVAAAAMLLDGRRGHCASEPRPGSGGPGAAVTIAAVTIAAVKIVAGGAAVGFLTGFLGVGGGFLVIPVLVVLLRMPMSLAVGTSLLIIVLNALTSVVARAADLHLDWAVIGPFTIAAVLGSVAGKRAACRLSGSTLVWAFAMLLVAVGAVVGVESVLAL